LILRHTKFLEVLADPSEEQHEEFVGWIGGTFDPESFVYTTLLHGI
jgi:hypothetical protein